MLQLPALLQGGVPGHCANGFVSISKENRKHKGRKVNAKLKYKQPQPDAPTDIAVISSPPLRAIAVSYCSLH